MFSQKLEYDGALGGSVELPSHVQTFRYAASSINEIKKLLDEIHNPYNNKLIFQTLPKHMRRRAMSHHPKRLPRKYRAIHINQMSKAGKAPQTTKRPSRKFRRKPSNLLKEYVRRQRTCTWLETHIWHAKRFHMISKWGYKLPYASCDKTYRACYRASAKHCLLQDISFYGCIEVQGKLEDVLSGFTCMTNNACGLSLGAKTYISGRREGNIELFKSNSYPNGAFGKVSFIWKPESSLDDTRTLWIFVHPVTYKEVLEEIVKSFTLECTKIEPVSTSTSTDVEMTDESAKASTISDLRLQFITRKSTHQRTLQYTNKTTGIVLTELKDTLNRFRLTGPLSQAVLGKAFHVKQVRDSEPINWFKKVMQNENALQTHKAQESFWNHCKGLQAPTELISNTVLGLNIEDPRIHRPQKRTKALPETSQPNRHVLNNHGEEIHRSHIWDFDLRSNICKSMMSTHDFCSNREKNCLVPGERCKFEDEMQPVPLLLVQRPGCQDHRYKQLGYSCGWDVIVPSGYGMPIWLSLTMWGARPGGLRELDSINRESGTDQFLPDSIAGRKESSERQLDLRLKYFKKPPNKRWNYRKLSICSPFKAPLSQLAKEWSSNTGEFFVLRDRDDLNRIKLAITESKPFPPLPPTCLVQISLKMKSRGNPGDFAIICIPTNSDVKRHLKYTKLRRNDPVHTELLRNDPQEAERKKLRKEHKTILKRLRRRRVREKRRKQETNETRVTVRTANTSCLVVEHFKKMCELWLPENTSDTSLRHQCSREVFGYVTRSEFSYIEATVAAVGYVTIPGLQKFLSAFNQSKCREKLVLVRGTRSRHYRFASFKVNCEI